MRPFPKNTVLYSLQKQTINTNDPGVVSPIDDVADSAGLSEGYDCEVVSTETELYLPLVLRWVVFSCPLSVLSHVGCGCRNTCLKYLTRLPEYFMKRVKIMLDVVFFIASIRRN